MRYKGYRNMCNMDMIAQWFEESYFDEIFLVIAAYKPLFYSYIFLPLLTSECNVDWCYLYRACSRLTNLSYDHKKKKGS